MRSRTSGSASPLKVIIGLFVRAPVPEVRTGASAFRIVFSGTSSSLRHADLPVR